MRDQWPLEVHGVQTLLDDGIDVHEMTLRDILVEILMELKKINIHLYSITDEEVDSDDIARP